MNGIVRNRMEAIDPRTHCLKVPHMSSKAGLLRQAIIILLDIFLGKSDWAPEYITNTLPIR